MRRQEDRAWHQGAVVAGKCKRGEGGGKPARMMEEECYSCVSSGFALQYRACMPAVLWRCQWDCEGIAHVDCGLQK